MPLAHSEAIDLVPRAAGVLMTVTGTLGGLCFAGWAGADKLWSVSRWGAVRRRGRARFTRSHRKPELHA